MRSPVGRSGGHTTWKLERFVALAAALLFAGAPVGAVDLALPEPDPERGTITLTMRGRFPAGNKAAAVQVYFVRLGEEMDTFAAESVIPSNFSKAKQVYLLNARPGRYVAVGAHLKGDQYTAFLDKAAIADTETEVRAGEVTFLGDFLLDLKMKMRGCDDAQAHYARLIEPDASRKGWMGRTYLSKKYLYRAELVRVDREAATRTDYWTVARDKVFSSAPRWRAEVEEELAKAEGDLRVAGLEHKVEVP